MMKIAQVAPLFESVPPREYGGTERVVSYLTEELVRRGHSVTLFASSDSVTSARLVPSFEKGLRLLKLENDMWPHLLMLENLFRRAEDFDIIHSHLDFMAFPFIRRTVDVPVLTTLHGRLDRPEVMDLFREYREIPVVAISEAQRRPLPGVNWQGTVYHGVPPGLYDFHERPGKYLAFIGRISPEKGLEYAISLSRKAGMHLKIAAKISRKDEAYYRSIKPLLRGDVEYLGEIRQEDKNDFLGNAAALAFTINWPEPFGLAIIEALACGTPVVARDCGSAREVITGEGGLVSNDIDELGRWLKRVDKFDRRKCRALFERKFSSAIMTENYLRTYWRLIDMKRDGVLESRKV